MTADEVGRLLQDTPDEDRRLFYRFGVQCGPRWQEIRRLYWEDLDLKKGQIRVRAEATKSRRADVLDMPPDLMIELRKRGKGKGEVFKGTPILRTWKADLERASIAYIVNGKQADRKCLRKTFCANLALGGVDLWTAVKMVRHRDPKLTVRVYTELGLVRMDKAIEKLVLAEGLGWEEGVA